MIDALSLLLAIGLTLGAALGFYRAQTRTGAPGSHRRWLAGAGVLALGLAWPLLGHAAGPVAGPCYGLVVLMLGLVALPYLAAWRNLSHGRRR